MDKTEEELIWNLYCEGRGGRPRALPVEEHENIIKKAKTKTYDELASEYNVSRDIIYGILKKHNVKPKSVVSKISDEQRDNIIKLRKDGYGLQDITDKYDLSISSIRNIIKKSKDESLPHYMIPKERHQDILRLFNNGLHYRDIAKKFNVTPDVVWNILKPMGVFDKHD